MVSIKLTAEQEKIVKSLGTPLRVLAGPGTGKTLCLIERVKRLINSEQISYKNISVITFTKAAAKEIRSRLRNSGIDGDKLPYANTLHGLALKILKPNHKQAGLKPDFKPIDGVFYRILLKDVVRDLVTQGIGLSLEQIKEFNDAHLRGKALASIPNSISLDVKKKNVLNQFSKLFHEHLEFYNAVDWHDVLDKAMELIDSNGAIKSKLEEQTTHLLVDEYQDLSPLEQKFISKITCNYNGLCIVGDDDQSIYSFKYADPTGIIDFNKKYPGTKSLFLSVCRRCPKEIIFPALKVIKNNKQRVEKELSAADERKGYFIVSSQKSKIAEIDWLADKIKHLLEKGFKPKDMMVLFTDGTTAADYVKKLEEEKIPLNVKLKITDIFESEQFLGVSSLLRWIINPSDNMSLRHVLNFWKGIGPETVRQLRALALLKKTSLGEAVKAVALNPDVFKEMKQRKIVSIFNDLINDLSFEKVPSVITVKLISRFPLIINDRGCQLLLEFIKSYQDKEEMVSLQEIIEEFDKKVDSEEIDVKKDEEPTGVRIMTMHSSKGCESKIVFIPALEDDMMPGYTKDVNIEEKRRLFYVSMTRAKNALFLSWARQRSGPEIHKVGGRTMLDKTKSRFLKEAEE